MAYSPRPPLGQATMTNSEPVVIASDQNDIKVTLDSEVIELPLGASTEAKQDTIIGHVDGIEGLLTTIDADTSNISTKIDTIAGSVSGSEMQVDIVNVPTVELGATSLAALENISVTIPGTVDLGTISLTALETITVEDGGGSLTIDNANLDTALSTLNTSINTLLKPANTLAAVTTITNVVHVDDNASSLTVDATNLDIRDLVFASDKVDASGSTLGANSGVDIGDVTINNAAGGSAVNIQDGGNSITVDGTITANAGTNLNTSALSLETTQSSIKTAVEIIDNFISGSRGLVTEDNSAAIKTAVELIDDTVATLGTTTYSEATTKGLIIGAVRRDADTTLVNTDNEVSPLHVDANGRLKVEAFSGETLPVSLTSTTITGTVAVTQSGTWDEIGINDSGNSITVDSSALSIGDGTNPVVVLTDGADNVSNANNQLVTASLNYAFDGTTWDRVTNGGGTEATAMRVTIASDSTGVLSIDDNGSSLTVDATDLDIRNLVFATDKVDASGTVLGAGTNNIGDVDVLTLPAIPSGTNTIGNVKITDGTDIADVLDLTNSNPLTVAIVDGSGNQITSFGGGTQYTEDDASVANPVGNQLIARRRDTLASETTTDGDVTALNSTAKGELYVKHIDSIPVTDNGTTLSIDDGAGSITIDGTVDTELPAAAALSDATANPTTPIVGAALHAFNGTTWDRVRTDGTDNDGDAVASTGILSVEAHNQLFNGTSWDRVRGDIANGMDVDVTRLPNGITDTFGKIQISEYISEIDVQFYKDVPANLVTITSAGGGTATQTSGLAQFASSTGTTGAVKGVTLDTTAYRAGGEMVVMFSAAWLDGGAATSYQRIGLYDTNNGFFMGYENTTFGIVVRNATVDTQTAKASWNVDTLVGGSTSKFTRAGVPEAIDLTKLNVFRIRFGWLGAAPIKFEVISPDGEWVLFHVIRQPNNSATPSIQNPDLPITLDIAKTAGATNLRVNTACWGAGINNSELNNSGSGTLGTAANSVVNFIGHDINTITVRIGTTTTGTIIFESTYDGTNWVAIPKVIKESATLNNTGIVGSVVPTSGDIYRLSTEGTRGVRVRTSSTLGATVNIFYNILDEPTILTTHTQIRQRNVTYRAFVPKQAVGANLVYFDLFNASGSNKKLKLLSLTPLVSGAVAVTGTLGVDLFLTKTSAVGTGGTSATSDGTSLTAMTITKMDAANPAIPSQITGRLTPTGGATAGAVISWCCVFTEETSVAAYFGHTNDLVRRNQIDFQPIVLGEGEGCRVVQGSVASVGNIGFDIIFELE